MSNELQLLKMLEPSVRPAGSPSPSKVPQRPVEQKSFADLLDSAARGLDENDAPPLKFSAHAKQRLAQRGVSLSDGQLKALAGAVNKAEAQGAKDSLMLMDRLGLIVNVPSRTVVTVMPEDRMRSGVVTQIDSAVIVPTTTEDHGSGAALMPPRGMRI